MAEMRLAAFERFGVYVRHRLGKIGRPTRTQAFLLQSAIQTWDADAMAIAIADVAGDPAPPMSPAARAAAPARDLFDGASKQRRQGLGTQIAIAAGIAAIGIAIGFTTKADFGLTTVVMVGALASQLAVVAVRDATRDSTQRAFVSVTTSKLDAWLSWYAVEVLGRR